MNLGNKLLKDEKVQNNLFKCCLMLTFLFICGCLLYVNIEKINYFINSDFTAQIVLGDLIKETNNLLPREWNFSTELHVSFATLFSSIFLRFVDSWKASYILSNVATYVILVFLSFHLCKLLHIGKGLSLLTAAIFLAPVSEGAIYYYCLGNEYMTYFIYELVFLILWLNIQAKTEVSHKKSFFFVWCVWCFFLGGMGTRYAMACFAPALLADILLMKKNKKLYFLQSWYGYVTAVMGFFLNTRVLARLYIFRSHNGRYFLSLEHLFERLAKSLHAIVSMLGYQNKARLFSWQGIICVIAVLFGIGLLYVIVHYEGKQTPYYLFVVCAVLLNFFIMIFTQESESPYEFGGKYFILSIYLIIPMLLNYCGGGLNRKKFLVVLLCAYVAFASLYACTRRNETKNYSDRMAAVQYLLDQGVEYGYASFWNANYTTYLSDGRLNLSNVGGDFENLKQQKWLSSNRMYSLAKNSEYYFVWMENSEAIEYKNAISTYSNDSFTVCIFKRME